MPPATDDSMSSSDDDEQMCRAVQCSEPGCSLYFHMVRRTREFPITNAIWPVSRLKSQRTQRKSRVVAGLCAEPEVLAADIREQIRLPGAHVCW